MGHTGHKFLTICNTECFQTHSKSTALCTESLLLQKGGVNKEGTLQCCKDSKTLYLVYTRTRISSRGDSCLVPIAVLLFGGFQYWVHKEVLLKIGARGCRL